jgi:hypothetical protein
MQKWTAVLALIAAFGALTVAPACAATPAPAAPEVKITYGAAGEDPNNIRARAVMTNSRALEELQAFLAPLRLPVDLSLQGAACGAAQRPYDAVTKTATICYETIAKILETIDAVTLESTQTKAGAETHAAVQARQQAIVGTIVEALLHETAYALFDIYNVPVWGRIDDAADRLSALVMLQFGEDAARTTILGTADFFQWSARKWTGSDFAAPTSPEAQRFYNFLCIAYGADPVLFAYLATSEVLPKYRSVQCSREYQQERTAFDLRLMPYIDPDLLVKARARSW